MDKRKKLNRKKGTIKFNQNLQIVKQSPNEDKNQEKITDQDTSGLSLINEVDESVKIRLIQLKKEDLELTNRLERLTIERDNHIRESRRIRDEDSSKLLNMNSKQLNKLLNERYLVLELIGKGGFSEVYKVFDLNEMIEVACKYFYFI